MRIWNFIFAKLPNSYYLVVFVSLNFQNRRKKKNTKNKTGETLFWGVLSALLFISSNDKQSKEESKWRPVFTLNRGFRV